MYRASFLDDRCRCEAKRGGAAIDRSHRFCATWGCAPLAFGTDRAGAATAAVNARCLEAMEPSALERVPIDGRSA